MVIQMVQHTSTKRFLFALRDSNSTTEEVLSKFNDNSLTPRNTVFNVIYKTDDLDDGIDAMSHFAKTHEKINGFIGVFNFIDNNPKKPKPTKKKGGLSITERPTGSNTDATGSSSTSKK